MQSEFDEIRTMLDGVGGRELPGLPLSVASALLTFLAVLAEPVLKCYRTNNNYYVYKLCDLMRIIFNYTPFSLHKLALLYMCRVADRFTQASWQPGRS